MGSEGQSNFYSLCSRGSTQYPTTGCVTAEAMLWLFFSFFFSQTAVRVCVSVHILLSFSQRRSIDNTFHHLRGWVAEWGLSWCWLWTLSVCTWVAHWAGTTITSTYSCSSRLAEHDFTFPFGATPDPAGSRLRLFSFQTALESGHSRPSFCWKCCDAPLRRVVASLPVETLQLFHVGTIRTWKEKRVIRGVEGCGEGAEEGLVWESKG